MKTRLILRQFCDWLYRNPLMTLVEWLYAFYRQIDDFRAAVGQFALREGKLRE